MQGLLQISCLDFMTSFLHHEAHELPIKGYKISSHSQITFVIFIYFFRPGRVLLRAGLHLLISLRPGLLFLSAILFYLITIPENVIATLLFLILHQVTNYHLLLRIFLIHLRLLHSNNYSDV